MTTEDGIAMVLDFWYAPESRAAWFTPFEAFDADVRRVLGPLHEEAIAGRLDSWRDSPEGCLALCILLDQAPRNMFVYLPFEHSEQCSDQIRSVELCRTRIADPEYLRAAERHREIVERFGRFPHRNAVLGRLTTPEERTFLREPFSSF